MSNDSDSFTSGMEDSEDEEIPKNDLKEDDDDDFDEFLDETKKKPSKAKQPASKAAPKKKKKDKKARAKSNQPSSASKVWEQVSDIAAMEGTGAVILGLLLSLLIFVFSWGTIPVPVFASVDCKNG